MAYTDTAMAMDESRALEEAIRRSKETAPNQIETDAPTGMRSPWQCGLVCEDIKSCCEIPFVKIGCIAFWVVTAVIITIVVLACSLETIESTEVGIAYDAYQAVLHSDLREEGLHTKPTFGYYIKWPKTLQQLNQVVLCLSSDGVEVEVTTAFQYTPDSKYLHDLTMKYVDVDNWKKVLRLTSRSGIRNACAKFTAQEYQTQRAAVQQEMFRSVKARLLSGKMHALVIELQVTNIERPKKYEAAVDAKEGAKNEIARVTSQRTQELVKANTKLMQTQVQANKTIDSAQTDAAMTAKTAEAEAAIVLGRYKSQGALYKQVRATRGLSAEGLLAYIGTRLIDELNGITVGLPAPAKVSYMNANATA